MLYAYNTKIVQNLFAHMTYLLRFGNIDKETSTYFPSQPQSRPLRKENQNDLSISHACCR